MIMNYGFRKEVLLVCVRYCTGSSENREAIRIVWFPVRHSI